MSPPPHDPWYVVWSEARAEKKVAERLDARGSLASVPGTRIVSETPGCRSNYWLNTLELPEDVAGFRDAILATTNDAGLVTRPIWTLMHRLAPYRDCPLMELTVSESLERRVVNLPSSPHLV